MTSRFQRPKPISKPKPDPIQEREELTRRMLDLRGRETPAFLMCARVSNLPAENVMPWYKQDQCFECGVLVWFDPLYAPDTTPHVCMPCANRAQTNNSIRLEGLGQTSISEDALSDSEQYARMMKSVSQHQHQEHPGQGRK